MDRSIPYEASYPSLSAAGTFPETGINICGYPTLFICISRVVHASVSSKGHPITTVYSILDQS